MYMYLILRFSYIVNMFPYHKSNSFLLQDLIQIMLRLWGGPNTTQWNLPRLLAVVHQSYQMSKCQPPALLGVWAPPLQATMPRLAVTQPRPVHRWKICPRPLLICYIQVMTETFFLVLAKTKFGLMAFQTFLYRISCKISCKLSFIFFYFYLI